MSHRYDTIPPLTPYREKPMPEEKDDAAFKRAEADMLSAVLGKITGGHRNG